MMNKLAPFLFLNLFCAVTFAGDIAELSWQPLFNGKNLDGWTIFIAGQPDNKDKHGYFTIHDGMIHTYRDTAPDKRVSYGVFMTKKEYSHYRLRFEYKWGTKRFAPAKKLAAMPGFCFTVLDWIARSGLQAGFRNLLSVRFRNTTRETPIW